MASELNSLMPVGILCLDISSTTIPWLLQFDNEILRSYWKICHIISGNNLWSLSDVSEYIVKI